MGERNVLHCDFFNKPQLLNQVSGLVYRSHSEHLLILKMD